MIADKLSQTEKVPVLYFFFRQIIAKNHDPQFLVRDWLSQLLPYSPCLQSKLKRQMEERQRLDDISTDELWESLLLAMASIPKLYCVADALDEMDISKLGFLDRLVELGKQRHSIVKILMTSRPLPQIESTLRTPSMLEISILQIRLQQNMVDTNIAIYVGHRLQQNSDVGLTDDIRETIRHAICTKGQGSFLYARLMMDELLNDTAKISSSSEYLERIMKKLPASLEEMYNGILLDHATRAGVPQELQLTILQWVTHSVRPLRLLELAAMIDSLDDNERDFQDTKALVRTACGPLLEILEDETVSIIHHSFTEFLMDPVREGRTSAETRNGQFPVIKSIDTHHLLALTCLKYLTSGRLLEWKLEWKLLDRPHRASFRKEGFKMGHPFLDYAASNVFAHVAKLERELESLDEALFAALDQFMKPGNHEFVSWIDLTWTSVHIARHPEIISGLHIAAYWGLANYCQHLIKLGHLDINGEDHADMRTPISFASERGHADIVEILLQNGANADDPYDKHGLKPLHYAARANHSAAVRLLLAAGVDPLTVTINNLPTRLRGLFTYTALMYACKGGGVESVLEFMKYLSAKDLNRALGWAVSANKASVVTALLECPNISMDLTENDGGSEALCIAANEHNPGMIRVLLEKGADPNARSNILTRDGWGAEDGQRENLRATPLHAVTWGPPRNVVNWKSTLVKEDALRECCELLIDAGADVNAIDGKGSCPIHYSKSRAITSTLLQHGAKATVESMDGSTPLHFICQTSMDDNNRGNLLELLVRHNADINAKRHVDGKTPLHLLLQNVRQVPGNLKFFFAYKPDVNAGDKDGNTPLHLAFDGCLSKEIIQDLLDAGADLNKTNFNMETPIHKMRASSSRFDVVQILLNAGADLEARDNLGRTCLLRSLNQVESVKKLLELGAKVDAKDIHGNSALHLVCQQMGSPYTLKLLAEAGADPKWINYEGNTLLHEASRVREGNAGTTDRPALLETLLELGVPLRQTNYSGATALHIACSQGSSFSDVWKHIIDLLVGPKFNLEMNEGDKNGIRPIHLAATLSEQLVRWLVEKGADPAVLTVEGQTPLQVACRARQTNVVGHLLELYQAQNLSHLIDWQDQRGRTALHDASKSGRPETVNLLLNAGADPNMKDCEGLTSLHVCSEFSHSERVLWSSRSPPRGERSTPRTWNWKAANVLIKDTKRPIGPTVHIQSMWSEILSEHDTARIRDSIRLLLAHGANVGARSTLELTPLDSALSAGCEVMVDELLPPTKKAFDEGQIIRPLDGGNPFAEQYLSLRSKHSPGILRDLVKKTDESFEWTKLLCLDDEVLFDELISLQVDFFKTKRESWRESFLETLVGWGYATLLEKFGRHVSMFHDREQMSKVHVGKTTSSYFRPLLHTACSRELPNMAVLMVLVDKLGVDVNARASPRDRLSEGPRFDASSGETALHMLARGRYWWQKGAVEFLLQLGADIGMKNGKGESPLSLCVDKTNNTRIWLWRDAVADVLLRHGANPNSVTNDGLTCLNKVGSNVEMARKLIKHGANVRLGNTPALFTTIASHDLDTVAAILESGAGCNVRQKSGNDVTRTIQRGEEPARIPATERTPLCYAALSVKHEPWKNRETALQIVRLLLENGADPYEMFDSDKTVLHDLLEFGGILQPFLELPELDLERRDLLGRTLLLAGCRSRFPASHALEKRPNEKDATVASILYGMGADITAQDSKGMNALHHLLQTIPFNEGCKETFSAFVKDAPLLVHQKDLDGNSPLHYALRMKCIWYIETLLSAGADPLEPDSSGNTALHHLAKVVCAEPTRSEQTQLFKKFISLGVPINARNEAGETPLFHYIAVNDREEILLRSATLRDDLTIFDKAGADFLARNNDMESLLHMAAKTIEIADNSTDEYYKHRPRVDRFRFLVELGCYPLAEDINQRTALDVAAAYGNLDILRLFQRGEESKLEPQGS